MFKDKEEALRRLEAELLREDEEPEDQLPEEWDNEPEEWDDEPEDQEEVEREEWEAEPGRQPEFLAYNSDHLDRDLESFSREVYDSERKIRGRWVAAAAMVVLAGLLLVLAFLAARYMGR